MHTRRRNGTPSRLAPCFHRPPRVAGWCRVVGLRVAVYSQGVERPGSGVSRGLAAALGRPRTRSANATSAAPRGTRLWSRTCCHERSSDDSCRWWRPRGAGAGPSSRARQAFVGDGQRGIGRSRRRLSRGRIASGFHPCAYVISTWRRGRRRLGAGALVDLPVLGRVILYSCRRVDRRWRRSRRRARAPGEDPPE